MSSLNIEYIGQCGFIIRGENVSLATDPVLTDLYDDDGNDIRLYPPVYKPDEVAVDYVFCTHEHIDHMAVDTLRGMLRKNPKLKIIVPKACFGLLMEQEFFIGNIIGMQAGEVLALKELQVTAISTAHPVHRVDEAGLDTNLAYSIVIGDKRLVHLGDTYWTEQLEQDLCGLGAIDYFFPPINGMDEERGKKGIIGNLNCEEAAKLAVKIKANCSIPTHFDMVAGNTEDPFKFVEELMKLDKNAGYIIPKLS